jgi:hypothetical protein
MKPERSRNNIHLTQQESGKTYELTQRIADVDLTVAFIGVLIGTILVPLGVILPFLFFPVLPSMFIYPCNFYTTRARRPEVG